MGDQRSSRRWLERSLDALGFENRLSLLSILQDPKTLEEIELQPAAQNGDARSERCLTRQGIQYHIDQLREVGLVDAERVRQDGRVKNRYRLRRTSLFALGEALRMLANDTTADELPGPDAAAPFTWDDETDSDHRPGLRIVHGASIGRFYPLDRQPDAKDRGWVIGGGDSADVRLTIDPWVDDQVAEIIRRDDGFQLLDLRASSCRAVWNGHELGLGDSQPLATGDLVGAGRTLMVFRTGDGA